ncbi:MAG: hypothetical protein ACTSYI_11135 [Promethearchaeota archaeon]
MITISTRIDEKILKEIEEIAHEMNLERGVLIRKYILDGYQENIIRKNIDLIQQGEVSIGQAAQNANVSIYRILETARQLKISIGGDNSSVAYEIEGIQQRLEE